MKKLKNYKFKRVYLLELTIAVIISLGIGSIIGMKYIGHVYVLQRTQAKTDMNISKRINFLEAHIKEHCPNNKDIAPIAL